MTSPPTVGPPTTVYMLGGVILLGVILYFAFMTVDGIGLPSANGAAVVVGKSYREAGTTYTQEIIGGRAHVVTQATPETNLLRLDLSGETAEGMAAPELYGEVQVGDTVRVTYQRRRITGAIQVVGITR